MKELAALPPDAPIVALGKPAARALLGINGIMKVRGFVWRVREIGAAQIRGAHRAAEKVEGSLKALKGRSSRERAERREVQREVDLLKLKAELLEGRSRLHNRIVLPTIHPAFVLRTEVWRPVLDLDLDRVVRFLQGKVKPLDHKPRYQVLRTLEQVKKVLPTLGPEIAHDIETKDKREQKYRSPDPLEAEIRCLGLFDGKKAVVIYPWRKSYVPIVSRCFKKRTVIGHNSKAYDEIALKNIGVKYPPLSQTHDTLIANHSFASHYPQGLAFVASVFTDVGPWKITFKQGAEGAEKGISPDKMPVDDLVKYNSVDVIVTWHAWKNMQLDLEDEKKTYLHDIELGEMCQEMQMAGIQVDVEKREWLRFALRRRAARILRRIKLLVDRKSFNPYAARDIKDALFYRFRAPVLELTGKTHQPSTSANVLQALAQQHSRAGKLSRLILKYRSARGTLRRNIDGVYVAGDNRVHATWKSFGTPSGRLSSFMQQLPKPANPKKPMLEERIRELYIAKPGCVFVYFDLSQAEMRMACRLSQDENFIKACSEKDIHSANACMLFPDAREWIQTEPKGKGKGFRDIAKNCSFAVNYLAGAEKLFATIQSQRITGVVVSMKVVNQMLLVLHREFKQHFKYIDRNVASVQKVGHLRTPLLGRICWFGRHPKPAEVANRPVQSGVADVMNERMLRMRREGLPRGCRLVGQFHDAAIYECQEGQAALEMERLIKRVYGEPVKLPNGQEFLLPIDFKVGRGISEL